MIVIVIVNYSEMQEEDATHSIDEDSDLSLEEIEALLAHDDDDEDENDD